MRVELARNYPTIGIREEDWPKTPEEIAVFVAEMAKLEPVTMTPEEEAELLFGIELSETKDKNLTRVKNGFLN